MGLRYIIVNDKIIIHLQYLTPGYNVNHVLINSFHIFSNIRTHSNIPSSSIIFISKSNIRIKLLQQLKECIAVMCSRRSIMNHVHSKFILTKLKIILNIIKFYILIMSYTTNFLKFWMIVTEYIPRPQHIFNNPRSISI